MIPTPRSLPQLPELLGVQAGITLPRILPLRASPHIHAHKPAKQKGHQQNTLSLNPQMFSCVSFHPIRQSSHITRHF